MNSYRKRMKNEFLKKIYESINFYSDEENLKTFEGSKYSKEYFIEKMFEATLFSFADNKVVVDDDSIRIMISAIETGEKFIITNLLEYIVGFYYINKDIARQYKEYLKDIDEDLMPGNLMVKCKNITLLKEQKIINI